MKTNATAVATFTTQNDFNQFLDVGSTPELVSVKHQLQEKIAAFPGNVRSALKDLSEARLTAVRMELSVR
jgi:hemerythrin superfamily protein